MKRFLFPILTFFILIVGYNASLQAAEQSITASKNYSLGESDLGSALIAVAEKNNLQIIFPSSLTRGLKTAGLRGIFTLDEALKQLLVGSGLGYSLKPDRNEITIYSLSEDTKNQLGAVNVEGSLQDPKAGINGSSDITATEGSRSYSTTDVGIGGKAPQSLKNLTQSVSVLTQQQMSDQNVSDLNTAMEKLPGITTTQTSSSEQSFYSRGWQIGSFSIDGAAPINIADSNFASNTSSSSLLDISMYDHIELLRGSDSLNSLGNSKPGGTINLVRKRPLDNNQISIQTAVSSWNDYRTSLDVTGPMGLDNKIRGRAVVTAQNNDYFYDPSNQKKRLYYGVMEFDISSKTVMRFGASYEQTEGLPWSNGLPRFEDGSDLKLPRNTSYALPWSRFKVDTENEFLEVDHVIDDNWNLSGQINRQFQTQSSYTGSLYGPISLDGDSLQYVMTSGNTSRNTQWLSNLNLNGKFDLIGLPQQVSLGGSYSNSLYHGRADTPLTNSIPDNQSLVEMAEPVWLTGRNGGSRFIQSSLVGKIDSVIIPFLPELHFLSALRWDDFHYTNEISNLRDNTQTRFSIPNYALRYDVTDNISVYGSYTDIYSFQPFYPTFDDKPLPPTTGSTREAGIRYTKGTLNGSIAFYNSQRKNLLSETGVQACGPDKRDFCYATGGTESSKGIDFEINGEPEPWWSVNFGYTFNINELTTNYDPGRSSPLSTFTPKHQFKLWNNFNLSGNEWLNKTQLGLGFTAQTKISNVTNSCDFTTGVCTGIVAKQGAYSVFSSRIGYEINQNWTAAFNVNNIFDRRYYSSLGTTSSGNWYGQPRNYTLSLQGKF